MEAIEARDSVPFSQLVVRLDIVRKRTFYIWKVFAPLIGIVALSWVVFWMSEDALGRRAGVSATAMLTIPISCTDGMCTKPSWSMLV